MFQFFLYFSAMKSRDKCMGLKIWFILVTLQPDVIEIGSLE